MHDEIDTAGGKIATASHDPVSYRIGGLPPDTLLRLLVWHADGSGRNVDIGFRDSGPSGTLDLSVPLDAVFALTTTPIMALPW